MQERPGLAVSAARDYTLSLLLLAASQGQLDKQDACSLTQRFGMDEVKDALGLLLREGWIYTEDRWVHARLPACLPAYLHAFLPACLSTSEPACLAGGPMRGGGGPFGLLLGWGGCTARCLAVVGYYYTYLPLR